MKYPGEIFEDYLKNRNTRHSEPRQRVLEAFLKTERHVSVDELYRLIRERLPHIGYATVYRTMKLISDAGLAEEIDLGDGVKRFEHKYGHEHHDHLICIRCGRFIEVSSARIEELQNELAARQDFRPLRHKLDIFGICARCGVKSKGKASGVQEMG